MNAVALQLKALLPLLALLEDELRNHARADRPIPPRLLEASLYKLLREFLSVPGKEFRARLVLAGYALGGGHGTPPDALPWLVEMLHAGSLIIDDIEDGSLERRGRPTLHRVHGVPLALNAGNWLYFWPFVLLEQLGVAPDVELAIHRRMAKTLLSSHRGQALDLSVRIGTLQQREVSAVVRATTEMKTGTLMALAAGLGAIAAGASPERVAAIESFGSSLGVALQMLDDLSGIVSEAHRDKGLEDLRQSRPTWPWAWLAEQLDAAAFSKLQAQSRDAEHDPVTTQVLRDAIAAALGDRGRKQVRRHLQSATSTLALAVGPSLVLKELVLEVERLEKSYG